MRVHHEKKSDRVRVYHEKERWGRLHHKKSNRVRVQHDKESDGEELTIKKGRWSESSL